MLHSFCWWNWVDHVPLRSNPSALPWPREFNHLTVKTVNPWSYVQIKRSSQLSRHCIAHGYIAFDCISQGSMIGQISPAPVFHQLSPTKGIQGPVPILNAAILPGSKAASSHLAARAQASKKVAAPDLLASAFAGVHFHSTKVLSCKNAVNTCWTEQVNSMLACIRMGKARAMICKASSTSAQRFYQT